MADRIEEIEERQKKEFQKFSEMLDRFSGELYAFRQFLETVLRLLLDISLLKEPTQRLASLLKASTILPAPIMKLYVHEVIGKAHHAKIRYGELFDALMASLGETVKDLELTNIIKRHFGVDAARKWEEILRNSNPSLTCIRDVEKF